METLCWVYPFGGFIRQTCHNPENSYSFFDSRDMSSSKTNFNLKRTPHNHQPLHSRIYTSSFHPPVVDFHTSSDLSGAKNPISIPDDKSSQSEEHDQGHIHHRWGALEIAEATGGDVIQWGPQGTVSIDTRRLMPGQWFFAIPGPNFDGHRFIGDKSLATEKGCIGVVGNRVCDDWPSGFVKVEGDTRLALEKMARYARNRFRGLMICLTGSVGKTTTRTMIALAIESLGQAYQTQGNFNYMVGLALTLIGIPLEAAAAVVEVGMGGREGEILKMAQMCRPSVRVVLNVSHCHMEHFGSLDDVARAKGELLMDAQPGDICVLNADDPLVMSIPLPAGVKKVLFGRRIGCDVRLVSAESVDGGHAVHVHLESRMPTNGNQFSLPGEKNEMVEFKIHGPGLHLATNACAAAAVAISLGVPLPQIGKSLSRFRPVSMRSQIEISKNGVTIINDTYNASLSSMTAAIESLTNMDCSGQRVAILGDMLELGEAEAKAHEMVLNLCCCESDASISTIMLVGRRFLAAARRLNLVGTPKIVCVPDSASLVLAVKAVIGCADVVLVKGSRGMKMEIVVEAIKMMNG